MTAAATLSIILTLIGCFFFMTGTIGLLRFPDTYSRLHALTKADNLGLGFVVVGLALHNASWPIAFKLAAIWLLVLLASSTACYLLARHRLRDQEIRGENHP